MRCDECHGPGACRECDGTGLQERLGRRSAGRRCRECTGDGQCTPCWGSGRVEARGGGVVVGGTPLWKRIAQAAILRLLR